MRPIFNVSGKIAGVFLLFTGMAAHGATLVSDNFNDGNANGWVTVKDSGSGTPAWQVAQGRYRQNNRVRNFVQSFHTGTYAYYQNGLNLKDYEVTVRLAPVEGDSVGVMFRYKSNSNYYRFSINGNQGFSRLERKVNGKFKALAFNGVGPDFSQEHVVRITVQGPDILVYLDGEPLFGARDTSLTSGSVALFAQNSTAFDDVVVSTIEPAAAVILSSSASYFVDTGGTLAVAAIARGVPAGGGIRFSLNNGSAFTDSSAPYAGNFTSPPAGDHTVQAVIVDSAGLPLADDSAQDENIVIGSRGRYFVAMGDSITNGTEDDVAGDNASADGRNVGRGYTPILNDQLSALLGVPLTVLNEGLGGTTAGSGGASGASRVASTKDRQTESRYWLIMFGTNDSGRSAASGKGLQPGSAGYSGTFKDSMQRIITSLKQSNKIPLLAKVPFMSTASASRDQRIRDYNIVIDELVVANGIGVTPPDFYTYFKQNLGQLADGVHPDGAGYQAMAELWFNALAGSGILNQ